MPRVKVNGQVRDLQVPGDTPLLAALREALGLRGTKFGCGMGACGACTVLLDGAAVRSCVTPVAGLADAGLVTIEALSANGGHPVLRAWQAEQVPRCGFCQSGTMLVAVALLDRLSRRGGILAEADLDAFPAGLCRCSSDRRVRAAIRRAAAEMAVTVAVAPDAGAGMAVPKG